MTFFYDLNKRLADIAGKQQLSESAVPAKQPVVEQEEIAEKWDEPTKVAPSEKGKYKGKTKAELKKQYDRLKAAGPHKKGSPEFGRMRELAFAIRAKSDWGKVDEAPNEGNEFSGELAQARASGAKEFKVDGKTYPVKESQIEEGYADFFDKKQMYKKIGADVEGRSDDYVVTFKDGTRKRYQETDGRRKVTSLEPVDRNDAVDDAGEVVKRGRGRPKGTGRKMGARGQTRVSEQDIDEDYDKDEYDEEGEMAQSQARTIEDAAKELQSILDADENLPEWVQKKINLAKDYIDSARDYLKANRPEDDMAMAEASTGDYSAKKARAGKDIGKPGKQFAKIAKSAGERYGSKERGEKVAGAVLAKLRAKESVEEEDLAEKAVSKAQRAAAGIAYAAKKGDIPKSELRGASKEMAKMPSGELKKFAKTKEKGLPEKKKEESVEETTTSGSVATAPAAGEKKSKGGMQFGKGIYDSMNREVEAMIAESMSINMSDSTEGGKSLTVSASDEDAMKLAAILKMAGLESMRQDTEEPGGCGAMEEAYGDVDPTPNQPDYPTDSETSDDALQYAGGLNKPKATGQTTAPVIAGQDEREHAYDDEGEILRIKEMAGIREAAKPDFPDIDKDGDREESIAKAAKDKEEKVDEAVERSLWDLYKRIA
jgi:hypothetical protein